VRFIRFRISLFGEVGVSTTPNGIGEICVSLDALLDTRLGTVAKVKGQTAALAALKTGYLTQEEDVYPGIIDTEEYRREYAKRDVATLQHSVATRWMLDIGGLMASLHEQSVVRPYFSEFRLAVNSWPYKLTDSAQIAIRRAVQYWTGPNTKVRLVHVSPEDMTPQFVLQNFVCLVDYDPYTWLNVQAKAFEAVRCPQITFIAPAIYHQALDHEKFASLDPRVGSPWQAMQFLTKPFVDLALVKPQLFRMVDQAHKPSKSASESESTTQSATVAAPPTA
jgi:hypothetical protein